MLEEVHDYLTEYGFNENNISAIENSNDNIFLITLEELLDRMIYLDSKEIDKKQIIKIINDNPTILSVSSSEFSEIDDLFIEELKFNLSELSQLIIKKPNLYNIGLERIKKNNQYFIFKRYRRKWYKNNFT